jgi:hypothetical protein
VPAGLTSYVIREPIGRHCLPYVIAVRHFRAGDERAGSTLYHVDMSETHKAAPRMSIERIIGATIVLLGALWIALPFLVLGDMGPGNKWENEQVYLTPWPYFGLVPIGIGLILIFGGRPGDDARYNG